MLTDLLANLLIERVQEAAADNSSLDEDGELDFLKKQEKRETEKMKRENFLCIEFLNDYNNMRLII